MMRNLLTAFWLVALMCVALAETPPSVSIMKVSAPDKEAFARLYRMGLDLVEAPATPEVTIVATDAEKAWLEAQGYTVEYVLRDADRFYASRAAAAGAVTMGGFRTLSEVWAAVDSLIAEYPAVVSEKYTIGYTDEARPIYAIRISDNPSVDESEPAVLFTGLHHAREPMGPHIVLYTMKQLASQYGVDPQITNLVDNREIWFVPIVNPDGYAYNESIAPGGGGMWRKNRHNNGGGSFGVDVNRNYGFNWGYDDIGSSPDPNSETYRGVSAFSEQETQAVRDFCLAYPNIVITMNYHSYSNLLLYPWGFAALYTPDQRLFAALADSAVAFNGYTAEPGWRLYLTNGDSDDWMYGGQGILSFTPEVGRGSDGFWPSPARIEPLTLENWEPNLLMIDIADVPERILPPESPVWDSIAVVGTDSLWLSWHSDDTLNPPVSYQLEELYGSATVTDEFEKGSGNWSFSSFMISSTNYFSSSHSLYSQTGDDFTAYAQTVEPYLVQLGDTLHFAANWQIEQDWDYAYVEVSTDAGETFMSIPGNITTNYNPHGQNLGNGITDTSFGWMYAIFPLEGFVGQSIYIRFSYRTDALAHGFGIYIDDVYPIQEFDSSAVVAVTSDTSRILGGHPGGTYAFHLSATDAEGQASGPAVASFTYEVSPTYTVGDVNESGSITSADVVYLVAYIFRGGPGPQPVWEAGDVNASGSVTSADIIYLINYIFRSGPPPIQP